MTPLKLLPPCAHRVLIANEPGMMFCRSPEDSGNPRERPPYETKWCLGCAWDKGQGAPPNGTMPARAAHAAKPRLTFDQLAVRRSRCQQLKAEGLPCPDDPASAAASPAAAVDEAAPATATEAKEQPMRWAYGVTTVPERRGELLPKTLASLAAAGFDAPLLFVDGSTDVAGYEREFGCETTVRPRRLCAYGNWVLALWELYLREPLLERYALFQDDLLTYRNLRGYLNSMPYPRAGYWNLYTFPENEGLCPRAGPVVPAATGRHLVNKGERVRGFYPSNQQGRGAVALVFDLDAVRSILTRQPQLAGTGLPAAEEGAAAEHMVDRVRDPHRRHCFIDGAVVEAMRKSGRREHVHYPTLVSHAGLVSSIAPDHRYRAPVSFMGEDFDALELLGMATVAGTRV